MDKWLETETSGSPFIIMDKIDAEKYNPINDFDNICSVKDYCGIIRINNCNIIVLGNESFPLKILNKNNKIILLRQVYAPGNNSVDKIIEENKFNDLMAVDKISANWETNNLVVFDSIKNYESVEEKIELKLKNPGASSWVSKISP
jgi:hypothetical protein